MPAPVPFEAPVSIAPVRLADGSARALSACLAIASIVRQSSNCGADRSSARGRQAREMGSDFRQTIEIRAQHAAVEKEIGKFSLADDFDQARGLEFLEV